MAMAIGQGRERFEAFFRAEYPNVYRAAFLASGGRQTAEDATQEAFERAYARWWRLSRHDWAGGWVMTTALNICKKKARPTLSVETDRKVAAPGHERADLTHAVKRLPPRQAQAILLFYLGDYPIPAIAQVMSISEGTVKAHLAQGRQALRELLGEDYV